MSWVLGRDGGLPVDINRLEAQQTLLSIRCEGQTERKHELCWNINVGKMVVHRKILREDTVHRWSGVAYWFTSSRLQRNGRITVR